MNFLAFDLSLQQTGYKDTENIAQKILTLLNQEGGFLEINDKTSADFIYELFGVSKKKYKMALGLLYKQKHITIREDGIQLINNKKS